MLKNITLVANNPFHFRNVFNTWNITSSHKKLLVPCYDCDAEYHIVPNCPLPCNEEKIKRSKELREASSRRGSGRRKGGQHKNNCGKCMHDK